MLDAKTIYADYQATTPVDPRVIANMAPYLGENRSAILIRVIMSSAGKQTRQFAKQPHPSPP